jgi:hypothetical protein
VTSAEVKIVWNYISIPFNPLEDAMLAWATLLLTKDGVWYTPIRKNYFIIAQPNF